MEQERRWLQLVRVDADQFWVFFEKYHDRIYRYLELKTGDPDAAQDLTQEVFVHALEHLGRFTWQGRGFGAWLVHIARKRVLPRYWRSGRRPSEMAFLRTRDAESRQPAVADSVEREDLLARVRGLVERFDDVRHDIFVLHAYMGWSLNATASAMGIPVETVRSHLRRGKAQLAGWLRDEVALTADERCRMRDLLADERGLEVMPRLRFRREPEIGQTEGAARGPGDGEGGERDD